MVIDVVIEKALILFKTKELFYDIYIPRFLNFGVECN